MAQPKKSKLSLPRLILSGPTGESSSSRDAQSHSINSIPCKNEEEFPNIIRTDFNSTATSSNPNHSAGSVTVASCSSEHSGEKKRKHGKISARKPPSHTSEPETRTRSHSAGILDGKQNRRGSVGTRSAHENPIGSRDNLNLPNHDGCEFVYTGRKSKSGQLTTTMHMSESDLMKELKDLSMRLHETSSHYDDSSRSTSSSDETDANALTTSQMSSDTTSTSIGTSQASEELEEEWSEFVEKMRHKLRLHFLTPWQKWRIRGLFPFRSLAQFVSIIIFSAQLIIYALYEQQFQLFLDENEESFRHLFLKDWDYDHTDPIHKLRFPYSIYSAQDITQYVDYAVTSYFRLDEKSIGNWTFADIHNITNVSGMPINMQLCFLMNQYSSVHHHDDVIEIGKNKTSRCATIWYTDDFDQFNLTKFLIDNFAGFELINSISLFQNMKLRFFLMNQHLGSVDVFFSPTCYLFLNEMVVDNQYHTGQDPVRLNIEKQSFDCKSNKGITSFCLKEGGPQKNMANFSMFLDVFTVIWSVILILLTLKTIRRKWNLLKVVKKFWILHKNKPLEVGDQLEFVNLWNVLIIISCIAAVSGSISKLFFTLDMTSDFSTCSVLLGVAVMFSFFAVVQNFTYSSRFNVLMLAVKLAGPNLIRFLVCILCIWGGFAFFAWTLFGGYHYKFQTFTLTMQTMFCLINGDDMFVTFSEMSRQNTFIFTVSQVWLFIFITLYICFVLGLIIGIMGFAYHEVKSGCYKERSEMEQFMNENNHLCVNNLQDNTNRLSWKQALVRFLTCQEFTTDFYNMKITFEK